MNNPYSTNVAVKPTPLPVCDTTHGTAVFNQLIDAPASVYARREAANMCRTCPLVNGCLTSNLADGEEWAVSVVRELANPHTHR